MRQAVSRHSAQLGHDTVHSRWAGARGLRRRRAACAQARGAQQARSRRAGRAQPGRWVKGLGVRAGYGLCTQCTQPVFDPD